MDLRFAAGLGRLKEMKACVTRDGTLKPDPGLADPFAVELVRETGDAIRVKRSDEVVLGQALLYACKHGRLEAAKWLVEFGAGVNAVVRGTGLDSTILHKMASYAGGARDDQKLEEQRRMPMVEWLLSQGADPTISDDSHNAPPSGWARHAGFEMMAELLESRVRGLDHVVDA